MVVMDIDSMEEYKEITRKPTPVVIKFWAKWCSSCQKMKPIFETCSEHSQYKCLGFYRVEIDESPDIMRVADVDKIPCFAVFKGGKRLAVVEGADNRALAALLKSHS